MNLDDDIEFNEFVCNSLSNIFNFKIRDKIIDREPLKEDFHYNKTFILTAQFLSPLFAI